MPIVAPKIKVIRVDISPPPSGGTIAHTTDLIKGDGAGNAVDSGIDPANVVQKQTGFPTPQTENDIISCLQAAGLCALILLSFILPAVAADFGDIPRTLVIGAGESVRRNAADTLFEAYTPGTGTLNATLTIHSSGDSTIPATFNSGNTGIKQVDVNNIEMGRLWWDGHDSFGGGGNIFLTDVLPVGSLGYFNVGFGWHVFTNLNGGTSNTAIGKEAARGLTTGTDNVIIGTVADVAEPTATNLTLLGSQVDSGTGVTDNAFSIGSHTVVTSNNAGVLGNGSTTDIYMGFDDFDSTVHATVHALGYIGDGSQLTNIPGADLWGDGGGTPIGASTTAPVISQSTFTITKWKAVCDTTCSVTIDVKRAADVAGLPVTSIVGGGTKPSISNAVESSITAPVGWTSTDITEGDKLAITFSSISGNPTHISLVLYR